MHNHCINKLLNIAEALHDTRSISSIASSCNVSTATVHRILDTISFGKPRLLYNDDLRLAHYLKEWFYHICQNPRYSEQRKEFFEWISTAEQSQIPAFEKCAATYRRIQ